MTARGGNLQLFGWSPEVFAANAHKTAEAMNALADKGSNVSPYELDPVTKSPLKRLARLQRRSGRGQSGRRTGSGEPLVVPESVTKLVLLHLRFVERPLRYNNKTGRILLTLCLTLDFRIQDLLAKVRLTYPSIKRDSLFRPQLSRAELSRRFGPRENFRGKIAVAQGVKRRADFGSQSFRNRLESELIKNGSRCRLFWKSING